jgi:hypothetical protein
MLPSIAQATRTARIIALTEELANVRHGRRQGDNVRARRIAEELALIRALQAEKPKRPH